MWQALPRYRLIAVIALCGGVLTWLASSLLGHLEQRQIKQHLQHDLTIMEGQFRQQLMHYVFATEWLARELQQPTAKVAERLASDSEVLQLYYPAMRQVLWLDPQFQLSYASPLRDNPDFVPRWQHPELQQQLQEKALPHARIVGAGPLSAVATDSVIIAAIDGPQQRGYLVMVLAVEAFFEAIIREQINEGYQLEVISNSSLLYRFAGNNMLRDNWQVEQPLKVFGNQWQLQLWPTGERLHAMQSVSQPIIRWSGVGITLMAMMMAAMIQRHRRQQLALQQQLTSSASYVQQAQQTEQRLSFLSNHDALTELENRNGLQHYLQQLLAQRAPQRQDLAILQINLDQFRDLNYALGHTIGDDVLKRIAIRLRKYIDHEQSVARIGGDEFALISTRVSDEAQTRQLADQVLADIQKQIFVQGHEIYCSASIGIAFANDANFDADTLLQHADSALNLARLQGFFGIALYSPSEHLAHQQRINLVLELRRALEAERLEIHFQPIVELRSRAIRGVESLLRIRQFDESLLPPEQFLPLMEQTGLILPLTEKLLKSTIQQISQWQPLVDDGFFVAINLSARQLAIPHLPELIRDYLKRYQVRPTRLQIELHEPNYMPLCEPQRKTLKRLKEIGIRLGMDSFGINQASLSAMHYCTPHVVKINRALLNDIPTDRVKSHVVDSMISLLRQMHLTTIAVGVESQQQIDFLLQRDCQLAQGYLLYRPLTADQLTATLNDIATSGEANAT